MDHRSLGRAASCSPAILFLVLMGVAAQAGASGIAVIPTRAELSADQRVEALTLTNHTNRRISMQLEVARWTQADGQEQFEPSADLLATPPVFSVDPGESQIIRVGLRRAPDRERELTYRVFAQELPEPAPEGVTGLRMVLRLSMPVFVAPATPDAEPSIDWQASIAPDGRLQLNAHNRGNRRAYITATRLQGSNFAANPGNLRYVLPDGRREWHMEIDSRPEPGDELALSARLNGEPYTTRVRID